MITLSKKYLKELEEAGCAEWTTMAEWRLGHPKSHRELVKKNQHWEFADQMGWYCVDTDKTKIKIKEFFKKNNRLPCRTSNNKEERCLAGNVTAYCGKDISRMDPKFNKWARKNGYGSSKKQKVQCKESKSQKRNNTPKEKSNEWSFFVNSLSVKQLEKLTSAVLLRRN